MLNRISFCGNYRFVKCPISSLEEVKYFETGIDKADKELLGFAEKSAFLNKLKETRDVCLCHFKDISKDKKSQNHEILSVFFRYGDHTQDSRQEVCQIKIILPYDESVNLNMDRFEKYLQDNSDISTIRGTAKLMFPSDKHFFIPLPNNPESGWCEFWTGRRNASGILHKLFRISKNQIQALYQGLKNS